MALLAARARARPASKPRPSSATTSRRPASRPRDLDPRRLRVLARRCAAPRARRGRRARRSRRPWPATVERRLDARPRAAGSAGRSSAASRPADSRRGGWISTSSVRRSRTPWRSRSTRGVEQPSRPRVRRAVGVVGQRREPERDAREVLHDAVVQVGGDPPALAVGGLDRAAPAAARARRGRAAAAAPATEASGTWSSSRTSSAAEQRRRERAQQPRGARADRRRSAGRSRTAPACRPACGSRVCASSSLPSWRS